MKIGYVTISALDEKPDVQINALLNSGCEMIIEERVSGETSDKPILNFLLERLDKDDIVLVWKHNRTVII